MTGRRVLALAVAGLLLLGCQPARQGPDQPPPATSTSLPKLPAPCPSREEVIASWLAE